MLAIVFVALVARLGLVAATLHYTPHADPFDYERHALAIEHGHYPGRGAGLPGPTAYRPPLYPFFLGAVYKLSPVHPRVLARIVQALLGACSVFLIGLIARRFAGRRAALVAMGIAAIWPPMWLVGDAFLSEALLVPIVLAGVAVLVRPDRRRLRFALLAGALVGLATLTRVNAIVLLLPAAIALWPERGFRRRLRAYLPIAAAVAAAVAVALPWTIRNALVLHHAVPVSTEDGYTLAGTYNPVAFAQKKFPAAWVAWYQVPGNMAAVHAVSNTEVAWGDALRHRALQFAGHHPGYVLKVAWWNVRRDFDAAGLDWLRFELGGYGLPRGAAILELLTFWPIAVLALAGALTRAARAAPRWLWLVPAVMLLPVFIVGYVRFRAPIDPFIAILAGLALSSLWPSRVKTRGAS